MENTVAVFSHNYLLQLGALTGLLAEGEVMQISATCWRATHLAKNFFVRRNADWLADRALVTSSFTEQKSMRKRLDDCHVTRAIVREVVCYTAISETLDSL